MSATQKRTDYKLAACHKFAMAAASEVTRAVGALVGVGNELPGGKELEQGIKTAIGVLGMLGHAGRSNQIDAIRFTIRLDFQQICAPDTQMTLELLFRGFGCSA